MHVRLTERGLEPLRRDAQGLVLDEETGTRLLCGPEAREYLEQRVRFERPTEVFVPAGASVDVHAGVVGSLLSDSAALYLAPGAPARLKVVEGEPVVVTSERSPGWYARFHPEEHREFARQQAERGDRLAQGVASRRVLPLPLLERLAENGAVTLGESTFTWAGSRWEEVESKLHGFSEREREDVHRVWMRLRLNRLPGRVYGAFNADRMTPEARRALLDAGAISVTGNRGAWRTRVAPEVLASCLPEPEQKAVVELYQETNFAGYDTTGLVLQAPGVSGYQRAEKLNLWSQEPSEWLLSSTCRGTPMVGMSSVASPGPLKEPLPFSQLRPAETLHSHPAHGEESQSETYLVTSGSAALLALHGGKPYLHLMHAGDVAVLAPGVAHCILAAAGDYEHMALQVPSTFQYGFKFKHDVPFPAPREELEHRAVEELRKGTRGSVPL